MNAVKNQKFVLGVYDVFNSALAVDARVGHRLTWSQAQAKAYRHKNFHWGGKISIKRYKNE